MATPNRFAIREVAEATLYALKTPYNAIVTMKTLKTTGVETQSQSVYARGGRGNAKLVGFSSDKEAKITLQDAILDVNVLAQLTGNDVTTGVVEIDMIYEGAITSAATLTLPKKVESITSVYILDVDGVTNKTLLVADTVAKKGEKYKRDGQVLTFADNAGTSYRVYYKVKTDASAKTVKVTADKFGGSFKLVLDCLVRDENTKADFAAQLIVPNAKIEDNWKVEMASSGDPTVIDIPVEVLKDPKSKDMWMLVIYDYDEVEDFDAPPPIYAVTMPLVNPTVSVANGTTESDAEEALDQTVEVVGTKFESGTATIVWSIASYDASTPGTYIATGVLTLPAEWTGIPSDVTASVVVQI